MSVAWAAIWKTPLFLGLNRGFLEYIFIHAEPSITMKKPSGQKTFGTSISFDLDLPSTKTTRRQKMVEADEEPVNEPTDHTTEVDCPGCGATITQEAWIQALVGFVSGARRYDLGEAVPGNVVQTLRNSVSNMDLPQPVNVWELSIVNRLTQEFDLLLQEGIERALTEMGDLYTREEVEIYVDRVRTETVATAEHQITQRIEAEVREGLEVQLRREIEQELWKQFDEELERRTQGS